VYINSPYRSFGHWLFKNAMDRALAERKKAHEAQLPSVLALLPEQASTLTPQQWEVLCDVLYYRWRFPRTPNETACLRVLQVLERHADTANLPDLSSLIATTTSLWANEEGSLAEAASRCLPALQARLDREKAETSLLPSATEVGSTKAA